jgi:quercetin dioxygenase-like cupin family protein
MTFLMSSSIHPKGWGHEEWIVNNELYCGKILHFRENMKCSFHYHKLKTETFHLQRGKIRVLYSYGDEIESADEIVLMPGQTFHVPIGMRHQMIAMEQSDLLEFSTQHFEEDSYRIVKGD